MGSQPMGKVPDLRRLAGRVASRSTVRWSWLWPLLGFCLLAAMVGGPTVGLLYAQTITFAQPPAATVGQPVALTAASVTMTSPPVQTGLTVSFRSDTPDVCTVSGSTVTPTTADV